MASASTNDGRPLKLARRAGIDEARRRGRGAGCCRTTRRRSRREHARVDPVADDRSLAARELAHAVGDLGRDGEHGVRAAQHPRLGTAQHARDPAWGPRDDGGIRPDVGGVPDQGNPSQRADHGGDHARCGRRLGDDDVGASGAEQPEGQRHVEAQIRQVAAHEAVTRALHACSAHAQTTVLLAARRLIPRRQHVDLVTAGDELVGERREPERRGRRLGREDAGRESDAHDQKVTDRPVRADSSTPSTTASVRSPWRIVTTSVS